MRAKCYVALESLEAAHENNDIEDEPYVSIKDKLNQIIDLLEGDEE